MDREIVLNERALRERQGRVDSSRIGVCRRRRLRRGIGGKACLLSLLAVPLLLSGTGLAAAQEAGGTVTGTVRSAEDGSPLFGANVVVKGTTTGTLTDASGRYLLQVPSLNDTLVFSLIGFSSSEVAIGGRQSEVNATLAREAIALDEIVVVGYGTQQRRDLTGAIASVDAEAVTEVATPSVTQALQGKVAGVQVTPASGEPGEGSVVRIRGVGTLGDASPLYVVDGMLLDDIEFLNPNDIASIDVLKDASATAIYGSRGANGVIIVTTKEGDAEQPTQFTLNAYAGMQSVQRTIDLVDAQQYATLANELASNLGQDPFFENPNAVGAGTDWQDEIFETAPIQNYQLAASGGTDRVTYYFSGNLVRQQGVIPRSDFSRFTFRINNNYDLMETFRLGHNINFAYTDDQRAPGVLGVVYRADPTIIPREADGQFSNANIRSSAGNPAATVFYTRNGEEGGRLVGNLFAEADFLDAFTFRSSFGLDYDRNDFRSFNPVFFVSPTQQNEISDLRVQTQTTSSWLWENTLNYNYNTDQHRLAALAGITAQSYYEELLGGNRTNLIGENEKLWYLNAGDAEGQTNENRAFDWKMLSYLFRTNYTLLDRYLLTASLRVDGSSRFGEENRYGWFPSFALGWNVAEESFFAPYRGAVEALKLRGSWGQIGNDKIGPYPGIPVVTSNLNTVFGPGETLQFGASPIELANPDVRWEQTTQLNFGADVVLFDNQVEATLEYYRRDTDGILVRVPIPSFVGVSREPFVNAAEVRNSGVEGTVTWFRSVGDFELELGANGSTINNEVLSLGGGREEILGGGLGNEIRFTTRTVPGEPIGSFWGFKIEGVFDTEEEIANSPTRGGEQPGDLRYADLNGDGQITEEDKTFIGSPIPDYVYGFFGRMNWRGFDLSASFSGQGGNEIFNGKKAVRFGVENFEESFLDRWTGPGTSDFEPRITNAGHNYQASERFIEDGSFLKLQTATLGYQLPESVTRGMRVGEARVYVSGTNLFTITDYTGYTPEVTTGDVIRSGIDFLSGVYPPARTITAGIDVTF